MENLAKQLDLIDHFDSLSAFFARKKPLAIEGDIEQNFAFIKELDALDLPPPPSVQNLSPAIARLAKMGIAKLAEIYDFTRIARFFEALKSRDLEGKFGEYLKTIEIAPALKTIEKSFDYDGNLLESAAEELTRVRRAIEAKKKQAKTELLRLAGSPKLAPYLVDRQAHLIGGEETLLLRGGFNHILAGRVIDRTAAGFFYVAPRALSAINDAIDDLKNAETEAIAKIERDFSAKLYNSAKFLRFLDAAFDRVDHLFARVAFAKAKNLAIVAPKSQPRVVLSGFAHPALKNPTLVSLDFSKPIVLVTGVNAGGKTMLLKSVLSAALMAKLLVPMRIDPHKSSIGRFKGIEAVIADPQNAKNDISTFAGRMAEFSALFSRENLLIGVDEIELGTDSDEAASLFKVLLERLKNRGSRVIATTHHKRLAALMAANDSVELIAALYDEARQRPTYSFLQGSIGRSYAFETALRYGVPSAIVSEARQIYGEDKERLNDLIERSSDLEREMRFKIAALDTQKGELDRQISLLKGDREALKADFLKRRESLEREYKEAIEAAKLAAKAEGEGDRHRALNAAHALKSKIAIEVAKEPKIEKFAVGDSVKYLGAIGQIVSLKDDRALVEADGRRIYARVSELKRAPKTPEKKPKISIEKPQTASVKLDLHGMRAAEALDELDRFLSDALMAGFEEVLVFHGVGSGVLARVVREALDAHPRVASYSDAPANIGGMGATIVKF